MVNLDQKEGGKTTGGSNDIMIEDKKRPAVAVATNGPSCHKKAKEAAASSSNTFVAAQVSDISSSEYQVLPFH